MDEPPVAPLSCTRSAVGFMSGKEVPGGNSDDEVDCSIRVRVRSDAGGALCWISHAHAQKKATDNTACAATAMDGKQAKWRCKAGQKCCFSWLSNKGTCIAASDLCLF